MLNVISTEENVVPDIVLIACGNHISKLLFISTPCDEVITHRLVSLPPGAFRVRYYSVLTGWGNLRMDNVLVDIRSLLLSV